ncbi:MAG: signal peptidase I [Armatimonadetes bacterium]|nr:MAG: signal peptidase I [Armatimonadota bacterium]
MAAPMFDLLAQTAPDATPSIMEKLARTPLSSILWFAAICTVLRFGLGYWANHLEENLEVTSAKVVRFFHDMTDALVYASILVFLLLRPYVLQTFRIPSESMVPTLKVGDWIIVNKFAYRLGDPQFGDIVVFKPPKRALYSWQDPNQDFVKRLIGMPGDVIEIRDSVLYRNGKQVDEPYRNEQNIGDFKLVKYHGELVPLVRFGTGGIPRDSLYVDKVNPQDVEAVWELPSEPIPDGFYLMMGDNRNWSADGRVWGLVPRRQIVGKAWFRVFPFSRLGGLH